MTLEGPESISALRSTSITDLDGVSIGELGGDRAPLRGGHGKVDLVGNADKVAGSGEGGDDGASVGVVRVDQDGRGVEAL